MKHPHLGLRTLALPTVCAVCALSTAPGAARAQTSVSLFGVMDAMVSRYSTSGVASVTRVGSGGLQASRLGVRGNEDLGGGMLASFWLEADILGDTGAGGSTSTNNQTTGVVPAGGLAWNRRSTVSLLGPWGELRLGRDYVPTFWNFAAFDPFQMVGAASASNLAFAGTPGPSLNTIRNSNSIGYLYNASQPLGMTGFYAQVQLALGENASNTPNSQDGSYTGLRAGYAQGPWNLAFGSSKARQAANGDFTMNNGGVSWDGGSFSLMAQVNVANSGKPNTRNVSALLGASINVGQGYIPLSYMRARRNDLAGASADQIGVGYVYNLSRRTALYATYARINNRNGAAFSIGGSAPLASAPNAVSSGLDLGIRHSF